MLRMAAESRALQQAATAELGLFALETTDVGAVMSRAAEIISRALGNELAEVLELTPDGPRLVLRAGAGWAEGTVGRPWLRPGQTRRPASLCSRASPSSSPTSRTSSASRAPRSSASTAP
jgi:hypothetical protein